LADDFFRLTRSACLSAENIPRQDLTVKTSMKDRQSPIAGETKATGGSEWDDEFGAGD
jgi:hypothetical protein